ncbi:hypothetical protein V1499_13280 [Neobacillus sp. SCS-31]|uniref:hypothetical protein n=1 Tax=Neobacillus oceani TaxID=3115292 RepID=UPI0039062E0D
MTQYPSRKVRSRRQLIKKIKNKSSFFRKAWAMYFILLGSMFLVNDTYSFLSDSTVNSNVLSAKADFCDVPEYAAAHKKECKCKGNKKDSTGDKDEKSCGENGKQNSNEKSDLSDNQVKTESENNQHELKDPLQEEEPNNSSGTLKTETSEKSDNT